MPKASLSPTKQAYENTDFVRDYVSTHALSPEMLEEIKDFAKSLPGKRVIDIGCGPGQDSWYFAKLGLDVVGVDYSSEMVKTARRLDKADNPPRFLIGDMRDIDRLFTENSFDGAWINAALLHLSKKETLEFLKRLKRILVDGGQVFISLQKGEGEKLKKDAVHGPEVIRKWTYWEKEEFRKVLEKEGFEIIKTKEQKTLLSQTGYSFI